MNRSMTYAVSSIFFLERSGDIIIILHSKELCSLHKNASNINVQNAGDTSMHTLITSPDDSCPFILMILPGSGQSANFSRNKMVSAPSVTFPNSAHSGLFCSSPLPCRATFDFLLVLALSVPRREEIRLHKILK